MTVRFPAMQATIGQRTYYACVMKLSAIPQMFTFWDWIEFTPEDREQRTLNEKRIPDIARYMLDNEDGYLFSSITASYKCKEHFEPIGSEGLGFLELDFDGDNFVINDGQHRCAAIKQAIRENPALREESISVLLFPYESKERVQQMFADLNRFVVKTNNATNIIFDHHDTLAKVTREVCEKVPTFQGLVDKEHTSLPARSEKVFTLYSLYDATKELVADKAESQGAGFEELVAVAVDYWTTVSNFMPDWQKVRNREIRPVELRQENISTHSVVLRALGGVGAEIMKSFPPDWKDRLAGLKAVNWSKRNRDWENVCMVANSVVANRQARVATKAYLKGKLGLPVSDSEQRSIEHLTPRDEFPPTRGNSHPANGITRGRRTHLRVTLKDGTVIEEHQATDTFALVLSRLGLSKVEALGIRVRNLPLVGDSRSTQYGQTKSEGKYICSHSSTKEKKETLELVAKKLGTSLKVEVIEND